MTKHILNILFCVVLCTMAYHPVYSQNTQIIDASQEPFTPESIIRNYFIGEGVKILDIRFEGENSAAGYFSNGLNDIGIDQGIVLGTGKVDRFTNASTVESSTLTSNLDVVNQELADIIGANILKDVITYEITFIPSADSIQFNYVFASEEYPEYVCSVFNDVFGFFISGPDPNGGQYNSKNIAIVPGTTNLPVSINNVNGGAPGSSSNAANCDEVANLNYGQFYNDNTSEHLIFDGLLDPFIAAAKVIPCQTYTIKISIGDVNDFLKDSAVFLEGKSFSSNAIQLKALTTSANGTITEGCASASIVFELPQNATSEEIITFELLGTAESGLDFEPIPSQITIPVGQSNGSIEITPIEDELDEDIESLGIAIMNGACSSDTIWLGIEDNKLEGPIDQGPIFLCDDLPNQVDYTVSFETPSPNVFRNQDNLRIEPINEPVFSTIKVENIYPSTLNNTDFIQVCIDELTHPWIDDLSIYLYGPDNQFIELSSKNGGNGGNGTQNDFFLNTCFTIDANQLISDPSFSPPYMGAYKPEGNWEEFLGNSTYKVNGDWRLMMIDDYQGSVGTLQSWSIHFGKSYDVNYSWSPNNGISCTDCPNPTFNPTDSQLYTLDIEDTNGCSLQYEVMVNANEDALAAPVVECQSDANGDITFTWLPIEGSEYYEVNIDNSTWQSIGLDSSYTISGLPLGSSVSFEIQAIGPCGNSPINAQTCSTSACSLELNLNSAFDPGCDQSDNGMILVEAVGGSEPYTFILGSIENTTGIFENLTEGDYQIFVNDIDDCVSEITVTLVQKEAIIINAEIDHIDCDEQTGSISLFVSGGEGQLVFDWSENFTGNAYELAAGSYQLVVSDESGCTAEEEFIINKVANFTAEFDINSPDCAGDANGSIEVMLNDASLIDDIIWDNGMEGSFIENLVAGSYSVVITGSDGCDLTRTIVLESTAPIELESKYEDNLCFGEAEGTASIEASGGVGPYQISWSNNQTGNAIENLSAGSYKATVTDDNGCIAYDTLVITDPEQVALDEIIVESPDCNTNYGSIIVTPSGGTAPYMLSLNEGEFQIENSYSNLVPGEYSLDVLDNFGCLLNTNEIISIDNYEEMDLITEPEINLMLGDTVDLFAYVSDLDSEVQYEWSIRDSQYLSCLNCQEPTFSGLVTTSVEVKAIDENGCETIENVVIRVQSNKNIYVPNIFSPNGDGINDRLSVFANSSIVQAIDNFSVYDRWGNQVFQSSDLNVNNMNEGWNGQYRGNHINHGVFVWMLKVTYIDGQSEILSGDVTLTR